MNKIRCTFAKGFTLIEFLVVVLIIGILAAIAVPQYKMAVYKSKYATLKDTVKTILVAEEVYYLSNGMYTDKFANLDIDAPGGQLDTSTKNLKQYPWGYCILSGATESFYIRCNHSDIKMGYFVSPSHAGNVRSLCVIDLTDMNSAQAKVCQSETNHKNSSEGGESRGYLAWRY